MICDDVINHDLTTAVSDPQRQAYPNNQGASQVHVPSCVATLQVTDQAQLTTHITHRLSGPTLGQLCPVSQKVLGFIEL